MFLAPGHIHRKVHSGDGFTVDLQRESSGLSPARERGEAQGAGPPEATPGTSGLAVNHKLRRGAPSFLPLSFC